MQSHGDPHNMRIGILGGGQLGLMHAHAARQLGHQVHIYAPRGDNPAIAAAHAATYAPYTDLLSVKGFGRGVDVVTLEFENVPVETLKCLERLVPVRPSSRVLEVAQDRFLEKRVAQKLGIPTTRFCSIGPIRYLDPKEAHRLVPGILKTTRMGYDGKGQRRVNNQDELEEALVEMPSVELILEKLVDFDYEMSVILARNAAGDVRIFPPVTNRHENGILRETSYAAGKIPQGVAMDAMGAARLLAAYLEVVGLLAVEFFVKGEQILFNEMAPRPHNSGHWTIEGCETSQFTLGIQAITGAPMGHITPRGEARMINLLGGEVMRADEYRQEGAHVHVYGKAEAKPGRKMGHVTFLTPQLQTA